MTEKTIYYHVGLGKAASTYLQKSVFPHLQGVHYIDRNQFKRHRSIVPAVQAERVLLSRENSLRLEEQTTKLAACYPNAIPIIVLRPHGGWIASQYRRYVKNGGGESFTGFIDLDGDQGVWRQRDLVLKDKLLLLEKIFGRPPYVIFYDRLIDTPFDVIDEFAALIGATYNRHDIPLRPQHTSYSDKQLLVLRRFRPRFFEAHPSQPKVGIYGYLRFRLRLLSAYLLMATARFFPDASLAGQVLVPSDALARIQTAYAQDWQACLDYAGKNNGYHRSE